MKIIIVGAGKLGMKVAAALIAPNNYITLVDTNPTAIQKANNEMDVMAIVGNGLNIDLYKELKIQNCDFFLALTNSDEKNLVIASIAKSLGCNTTIARLRDPEYLKQQELIKTTFNVDYVVNPDHLISLEIFNYLVNKHKNMNQFFTGVTVGMMEIKADAVKGLVGDKVLNASKYLDNMLITAISRKGKIIIPDSNVTIEQGDVLYILGKRRDIPKITPSIHTKVEGASVRKVMIMGGGKTGYYLGKMLSAAGVSVKIIEKARSRCDELASMLDNVLILHGDGSDVSLLQEENITGMDAFVTATGFDEDNIILALMAQQYGVKEVIAKTSRGNYSSLTDKIGVNTTMNTLEITTGQILRIVNKGNFMANSFFLQGQAEVMEVIVQKEMLISGKKLKDLPIPSGVLIPLIYRDSSTIVPDGNTQLMTDDRLIFFSMLKDVPELERLLQSTKKRLFRI